MNNKKKERSIVVFLVVAILLMTIGFAAYTQTLTINGTVNVKAANWNVHYVHTGENYIVESANSESASAATVTDTDYSFTVTLNEPGDFYEATINVINEGTIGATLNTLTMSTLSAAQQNYLSYKVYYNGTEYTETTSNLAIALAAGATVPVKVRVEYLLPADSANLPASDTTVTVTGSLAYSQAQ